MSNWDFSVEEVRDLVQGKFTTRICLDCGGKGYVLTDIDGEVVTSPKPPKPENMTKEEDEEWEWQNSRDKYECDQCHGLGCFIKWLE